MLPLEASPRWFERRAFSLLSLTQYENFPMKTQKIARLVLIFVLALSSPMLLTGCFGEDVGSGGVINAESCQYSDNLNSTAESFISRCREGSINRVFPAQYYPVSLLDIKMDKSAEGKKAYKLLNDRRFKK
jgi:hypothetical protein